MNLPDFAVKRPLTIVMVFLAALLFGVISLSKLGMDMLPDIEPPAISVLVPYPGALASDVESDITKYLEDQLSTVEDLDKLTSLSKDNLAVVTCHFKWGTNLDVASNDVRDKIDLARKDIEEHAPDAKEPMLFKFSSAAMPIMIVTVSAEESWKQLYHIVDKQISDPLKRIKGVGAVISHGGLIRQINVQFDWQKLEAYKLSPQVIARALKQENLDMPSGEVKMGKRKYYIRVAGRFKGPQEIKDIIVEVFEGKPIYLKDVADVSDSFEETAMKGWGNGKDAVMMIIQKQSGANTVEVCKEAKEFFQKVKKDLPSDVEISIPMDNSEFIINSINNLSRTLAVAGILVVMVALLFLRKLMASVIVSLAMPFSLIIAFIFLFINGFTINVISLMSLAIAIGMVVDGAIVVLENITRHIDSGEKPREAAVFGANEVGTAITASALTTIAVFLPLIFITGIAGIVFKQLGIIVSIAILASLCVALTLTPMLASRWIKPFNHNGDNKIKSKFFVLGEIVLHKIEDTYGKILDFALANKKKILFPLLFIFLSSLLITKFIGNEFMPDQDTGDISVNFSLSENARLEETERVALEVMSLSKTLVPEQQDSYARIGQTKEGVGSALGMEEGPNIGTVGLKLVAKNNRERSAKEIANILRSEVKKIPGIEKVSVTATTMIAKLLMGGGKKIEVEIMGHDLDKTNELAEKVKEILEQTSGAVDIRVSRKKPRFEVWIQVDRKKAGQLGVNVATVASVLRSNYYGSEASKFRDAGDDFDIFVQLKEAERSTLDNIGNITIPSRTGLLVKLKNIAKIEEAQGPVDIERKNRERIVKVGCDTYKRSLGEVKKDIEEKISKLAVPPGITLDFGGEVEEQKKAFGDLFLLLMVGLILVYMVMVSQFESLKAPFIILFSIPFAFIGVAWALFFTHNTLNLMSFMAMIMLIGVVVNNAIVLVDYIDILRARGLSLIEAVKQGGRHRLRPVLMTSFSTIFGMLPLALSRGEGSEMWQPFGITAVGGLLVSTFVTLILVPVVYAIAFRKKEAR